MCVFDCDKKNGGGLTLVEIASGLTVEDIRNSTGCDFNVVTDSNGKVPLMDEDNT